VTMAIATSTLLVALVCAVMLLLLQLLTRPRYEAKPLLTGNEHEFFGRLCRAHHDGYVFPQVAMSALLEPQAFTGASRRTAFYRIAQKRVDYVICTRDLQLLCVVELDDRTHDPRHDRQRAALLGRAGILTLRWDSRSKPTVQQIRDRLQRLGGGERAALQR